MALLLKTFAHSYVYVIRDLHDKRADNLPLIASPVPVIFIIASYLFFVFEIGPKFMKNRQPFNIDKLLMVYNASQIVLSLYIFVNTLPYVLQGNLTCIPVDYSPESWPLMRISYLFFITKIIDLLDTVFFVLRKKNKQISFLHVYHHSIMVAYIWFGVKYVAGGQLVIVPVINSFVHSIMYFYYLLTSYDAKYKTSVWWKKHITQLQLFQFAIIGIFIALPLFQTNCGYPRAVCLFVSPQLFAITALFADFYYKAYIKKKTTKIYTNNQKIEGNTGVMKNKRQKVDINWNIVQSEADMKIPL